MFSKEQQGGILLLAILIVASVSLLVFYKPKVAQAFDFKSPEILQLQCAIDSLKGVAFENKKPKIYPFNPNFITDYKAYNLGLSTEQFDRLSSFRSKDKWINSIADFKRVTKVSDSLLNKISPFFKFPDWITNPNPRKQYTSNFKKNTDIVKNYADKIDLNIATAEELQVVRGIGKALSKRIFKRRKYLGGFSADNQLYGVWGVDAEVVLRVLGQFTVKTPKVIIALNVNTASASDIATIPGISFDLATDVWEFVTLRERIVKLDELRKIEAIDDSKFKLIQLYLTVE